jgi:zinc resistance-associated protein
MNNKAKGITVLTVVAIFGIAALALAGWGPGYGYMMGSGSWPRGNGYMMGPGGWGPGMYQRGGYGYGQEGYYGNLSAEDMTKLDQQRAEYFKATENIRQKLYENELALRSELAKQNPDNGKAASLQSEISKLQGELDQKRLDYDIQARKATPNYNGGYGGYGPMMGYGPGGGGYCMW